jgi:hypothetical protein
MSSGITPPVRQLASALLFIAIAIGTTCGLRAQTELTVEHEGKPVVVRHVQGRPPFVEIDGKWVRFEDSQFVLRPAKDYLPVKLEMRDRRFQKGAKAISDQGSGQGVKNEGRFALTGNLLSPQPLDNVVLVLEFRADRNGPILLVQDIGHLDANVARHISIDDSTHVRMAGIGLKKLHVFVNGAEAHLDDDGAKHHRGDD